MITTINSSRVYYKDLLPDDVRMIHHDISLYHAMKNHIYNVLYNNHYDITDIPVSSILLKKEYGIEDNYIRWETC